MHGVGSNTVAGYSEKMMELCEQAKLLYDFSPLLKTTLLSYGKNADFLMEDRKKGFYTLLRISEPGYRSKEEITGELRWLHELSRHPLPFVFPEVIPGFDGRDIQQVRRPDGGTCQCVLFTYLRGRPLASEEEKLSAADVTRLGEAAALLHQNVIQWDVSQALSRWKWDPESLFGANSRYGTWSRGEREVGMPSEDQRRLFDGALATITRRLRNFGRSPARFGLIHANLSSPDVFYYRNRLAITGFDNCGFGWYLYDFAALAAGEEDTRCAELTEAWLKGYARQRHLSGEDRREIPTFVMMRRLADLCRVLNIPGYDGDIALLTEKTAVQAESYLQCAQSAK